MEPIELHNCFVEWRENTVSILFKRALANSTVAARKVIDYLVREAFIHSGNYKINIGMPIDNLTKWGKIHHANPVYKTNQDYFYYWL